MNKLKPTDMGRNEKISIIMPAFNAENYVFCAVQSCLEQTYENWELIIVDDCSTDSTIKEIQKFNDSRIRLYKLDQNSGPGMARNIGLEKCSGEWITVLDADDAMCLNRLATFREVAIKTGQYFVYYDVLLPWISQKPIPMSVDRKSDNYRVGKNKRLSINQWLIRDGYAKPFFHRSLLLDSTIRYPEGIRGPEDTVFLVMLCAVNNVPLIKLATRSYIYRETPGSLSNRGNMQINAAKVAYTLLVEISRTFPSVSRGVEKYKKANMEFEEFLLLKHLFKGRKYGEFLHRIFSNPRNVLIVMRKTREKSLYEILRISRNLSRILGARLIIGKRSGA